jgi:hypothetical protein
MNKGRNERSRRTRRRIAVARAKREHADTMAGRYYRTLVKRDCRCSACGRRLRSGKSGRRRDDMVYSRGRRRDAIEPLAGDALRALRGRRPADQLPDLRGLGALASTSQRTLRGGLMPQPCRRCGWPSRNPYCDEHQPVARPKKGGRTTTTTTRPRGRRAKGEPPCR